MEKLRRETDLDEELQIFDFTHFPLPNREGSSLRIFYNNINGLEINSAIASSINNRKQKVRKQYLADVETHTKVEAMLKQMYTWDVNITALSEPCIEWRDSLPRKIVRDIGKKQDRLGHWTVATSKSQIGSFVKPGGALIYNDGTWSGRLIENGSDPWGYGRWAYKRFQGKRGNSLLVVSAYRVSKGIRNGGPSTAWHQQKVLMAQENRIEDPADIFITDLESWLGEKMTDNTEVVLFVDANEQWHPRASIKRMSDRLLLYNLNVERDLQFPATHPCLHNPERNTTIDFCLCTTGVLQHITYATMAPYDLACLGDHRGILIDIDTKSLFGISNNEHNTSMNRKLVTKDPIVTKRYLRYVEERFDEQRIVSRVTNLYQDWTQKKCSLWDVQQTYEILDREIYYICRKGEKKCRPTRSGNRAWSPALIHAIQTLSYWKARKRYQQENALIRKLGRDTNIAFCYHTEEEIDGYINHSRHALADTKTNAIKYRQQHLETLAESYAASNNLTKANAIQELLSHESVKHTFEVLKEKLKPRNRGQIGKIWIAVDDNGNYTKDHQHKQVLEDEKSIHTQLLRRNKKHLTQAKNTPFARGRMARALRWDGTGDLGRDILSGDILNQERFSRTIQLYLESLKVNRMSRELPMVKPHLSLEEYAIFWKKKREDTVTSPFGLHIGHYKAALQNKNILNVHRIMLLIPFQTAVVPSRWKKTVQTMLEKDPGNPWIHRLRIIELFDAQVNAGFQLFIGRKMVWNAVQNNKLHPASYGSTPGKMAASAVLQKILSVDQLRFEQRAGGLFDCDATGCYDRILPPVASVHLQALGLHHSIGTTLARLMFTMKRYVKTKHGVSKQSIRTTRKNTLYGIGQGNGGGPAIWLAHLTVMFTALSAICTGFLTTCIEGIYTLSTVGTGYVDDVTLMVTTTFEEPQTEVHVKTKVKHMATIWEKLLYLTGGKLELSKCFWVPIIWGLRKGDVVLLSGKRSRTELYLVESETGETIKIPKVTPSAAEKRLGIRYSLDGKWTGEYKYWLEYTKDFAQLVRRARLDRIGGYHAYHTLWCSKFRFSSPVVGFTIKQLSRIQQLIIGNCLAAAGYNSKMPRAVVFGTTEYGGMSWASPHCILMVEQLKILIGSLRLRDTVGCLLEIQLKWLQLISGISTPVLECTTCVPYLPPGWITALHHKLVYYNIKVKVSDAWQPELQRKGDHIIMDFVTQKLPPWMWGPINKCRLFMQAVTLADIATFDGTHIPQEVYLVKNAYRKNTIRFPLAKRPPKTDRVQWQYYIRFITQDKRELLTPLTYWSRTPYQLFPYAWDPTTHLIYSQSHDDWIVYYHQANTRNRFETANLTRRVLPQKWIPTNVIRQSGNKLLRIDQMVAPVAPQLAAPVFGRFITKDARAVVGQYEIDLDVLATITRWWKESELSLVCGADGGLKDGIGTSGYIIQLDGGLDPIVYGHSAELQPSHTASSTRQELLGQLALEYWMEHMEEVLGEPYGRIEINIVTDSQASIDILRNLESKIGLKDVLKPDVDVGLAILYKRRNRRWAKYTTTKVRSHISVEESSDEILWLVNEEADRLATEAREKVRSRDMEARTPQLLPGMSAGCTIGEVFIHQNLKEQLHSQMYDGALKQYLCEKYDWDNSVFGDIDWTAHKKAITLFPRLQSITIMKYIHGWLATKRRRYRDGAFEDPLCPLCLKEEGHLHIFMCQHPHMAEARTREYLRFETFLKSRIDPAATQAIQVGVRSINSHEDLLVYEEEFIGDRHIKVAMDHQQSIGWKHFLYGRISTQWKNVELLEEYKKTPSAWAAELVFKILDMGRILWRHRNMLFHGNDGEISKMEIRKVQNIIQRIYSDIGPTSKAEHSWLFAPTLEDRLQEHYSLHIMWIDSIRRLYPTEYGDLVTEVGNQALFDKEIEYMKSQATRHGVG